jgi:hypothetical protein
VLSRFHIGTVGARFCFSDAPSMYHFIACCQTHICKICLALIWLEHFLSHILVIRVGSACRSARYGLVVNPLVSENNLHLATLDSDFRVCLVSCSDSVVRSPVII